MEKFPKVIKLFLFFCVKEAKLVISMRKIVLLMAVCLSAITASAQRTVTGKVVEQDTKEAVIQATAALLSGEKVVANAVTDASGGFSIKAPQEGSYTLKITYVGFKTYTKKISIKEGKDYRAGTISLEPDAIMLQGATVTAHASKVTLKADTFVYNAAAFRTPEGSVVEELVRRLPGAEVSDDGTVKINGKEVKKFLVDGKEFMSLRISSIVSRPTISRAILPVFLVSRMVKKRQCLTSVLRLV